MVLDTGLDSVMMPQYLFEYDQNPALYPFLPIHADMPGPCGADLLSRS
jgi:hypothetical protein